MTQDCKLSTGRTIKHRPMANGAQEAYAVPGNYEMTNAEWEEYCAAQTVLSKQRGSQYFVA